jgi:threonyl-tRNA synthetase
MRRVFWKRHLWSGGFDYRAHRIRVWNESYERFGALSQNHLLALDRVDHSAVDKALGVRVNGKVRDVRAACSEADVVEPVLWDSDDAKLLLWHSSAHLMGDALEQHFEQKVLLCDGPPLLQQGGFFYEFWTPCPPSTTDFVALDERMMALAQRKRKFETMTLPLELAREMFSYNAFKMELLDLIARRGDQATVYRSGDFIDLCRGPHVPNTGRIKFIKCLSTSASTGKLNGADVSLHRVYGISFPSVDEGKQWEERRAELERRDHRAIGQRQHLLMFSDLSPGSAFFLPDGAFIYNRLLEFLRHQYRLRGYQEVITPLLYNKKLWETSGHWDHYKRDMFFVEGDEPMGLKPMNCPSHCLIFGHVSRSHRELPLRLADFGVLHRNEESGALTGLTRVRKFQQDDAHIFCREDQLEKELAACLDFLKVV